jgi:hypothetical protein
LESIASGTSAITSNIPVLVEILGKEIACFDLYEVNYNTVWEIKTNY